MSRRSWIDVRNWAPPHSIDVQTIDHVVYLNGFVGAGLESDTAQSVADGAPGVARVVNDIAVTH